MISLLINGLEQLGTKTGVLKVLTLCLAGIVGARTLCSSRSSSNDESPRHIIEELGLDQAPPHSEELRQEQKQSQNPVDQNEEASYGAKSLPEPSSDAVPLLQLPKHSEEAQAAVEQLKKACIEAAAKQNDNSRFESMAAAATKPMESAESPSPVTLSFESTHMPAAAATKPIERVEPQSPVFSPAGRARAATVGSMDSRLSELSSTSAATASITPDKWRKLDYGSKVYVPGMDSWRYMRGDSVLHLLAGNKTQCARDLVTRLIQEEKMDVNVTNHDGSTALHSAYFRQNEQMSDLLVSLGASKTIENNNWETPIQVYEKCQTVVFVDIRTDHGQIQRLEAIACLLDNLKVKELDEDRPRLSADSSSTAGRGAPESKQEWTGWNQNAWNGWSGAGWNADTGEWNSHTPGRRKLAHKTWIITTGKNKYDKMTHARELRAAHHEFRQFLQSVTYKQTAILGGFNVHHSKLLIKQKMKTAADFFYHQCLNLDSLIDTAEKWWPEPIKRFHSFEPRQQAEYFRKLLFLRKDMQNESPRRLSGEASPCSASSATAPAPRPETTTLAWLDIEMADNPAVDIENAKILEIGVIVTDWELEEIARESWVVHKSQEFLEKMPQWHQSHFATNDQGGNGLIQACVASKLTHDEVEMNLLNFLKQHCDQKQVQLAGFSVHHDWECLKFHMKTTAEFFSDRLIDISTFEKLFKKWDPERLPPYMTIDGAHRALPDCELSLRRMKAHREALFRS